MQKEIYARGSIACGIDAGPILNYTTGVATGAGEGVDHVISVVGWGVKDYTAPEKDNQVHCFEGGENCQTKA
jgi:cathepsin X